jgi:ribosomal-protein-alanine N-acetyltransferase
MVRSDPLGVVGSIAAWNEFGTVWVNDHIPIVSDCGESRAPASTCDLSWSAAWEHGGVSLYVAFGSPLPSVSLTEGPITLRAFADRDLPVVEAASRDALIPTISTIPASFTEAAGRAYIERQNQRSLSGEGWSLAIADAGTDVAFGQIGLWIGHLSKGRAEIGYWIAPGSRRMGAASRALGLLVGWAFEQLDVDRLSLFIEPWNEGSIKTAERAGFTRDGTLRGWERIDGESKDMLSFARLRSDGRADV